jgi:homocysteine S-methyltransferase
MAMYRDHLPQLDGKLFLTDSGLETTLIFRDGYDLPAFASFPLIDTEAGRERIADYYRTHATIARDSGMGFIVESVGWRANRDWGEQVGYSPEMLDRINRDSIVLGSELRAELETPATPVVLSGCIGPRGDAYRPDSTMSELEAERYHHDQIATLSDTEADLVSALTLTYPEEAIGVVRAAQDLDIPAVISFTVETDGRLPSGMALGDAIARVDDATDGGAAYFMVNCAHPTHFDTTLDEDAAWMTRIRGLRANASRKSHAELDEAEELDAGDPEEFGREHAEIRERFAQITVLGGCCGTDERHVAHIARSCIG